MRLIRGVPPRSSPSPTVCDTNSFFPAHDGRKEFVSQTVGEGELRRGPPRIHRIKRMARLEVVHDERRREVCSVYVAEQEEIGRASCRERGSVGVREIERDTRY